MPSQLTGACQWSQGMKMLDRRDDVVNRLLNGTEQLVGHDQAGRRVLNGRQSAVQRSADVTDQDVRLVSIVDVAEVNLTIRLQLKSRAELISEDGLVETGGKFVGLLHKSRACQAW